MIIFGALKTRVTTTPTNKTRDIPQRLFYNGKLLTATQVIFRDDPPEVVLDEINKYTSATLKTLFSVGILRPNAIISFTNPTTGKLNVYAFKKLGPYPDKYMVIMYEG